MNNPQPLQRCPPGVQMATVARSSRRAGAVLIAFQSKGQWQRRR